MTSLTDKTKKIRDLLTPLHDQVHHYVKPAQSTAKRYIVWAEDGSNDSFSGNNRQLEQEVTGTIDLYTQTEYDPLIDSIQDALNEEPHVSWMLSSVSYEDETNLIHYEWIFGVA